LFGSTDQPATTPTHNAVREVTARYQMQQTCSAHFFFTKFRN